MRSTFNTAGSTLPSSSLRSTGGTLQNHRRGLHPEQSKRATADCAAKYVLEEGARNGDRGISSAPRPRKAFGLRTVAGNGGGGGGDGMEGMHGVSSTM